MTFKSKRLLIGGLPEATEMVNATRKRRMSVDVGGVESGAFFKLLICGVLTKLGRRLILGAHGFGVSVV